MARYKNIATIIVVIISAIAALRFISLGMYPLLDPTEGRYAEIGRKMLELGNWVTPYIEYNIPFWAKPPLSFWLSAASYKIFGVNEFAARLPSFLAMSGIVLLVCVNKNPESNAVKNSSLIMDSKKLDPYISALILSSMALFFYLAGGVMTDPSLSLGITLSMVSFWRSLVLKQKIWGYAFFVGIAIALLAKGPIGVVLIGMPILVWTIWHSKWKELWHNIPWIYGAMLTAIVVLPWYIIAEKRTPGFINYFIVGEHFERFVNKGWKGDLYGSGRAHPVGTIWLFCFAAMFPWSLIFLAAPFSGNLRKSLSINNSPHKSWHIYLWLWALAPLVFFTMAKNILITYVASSLPAFAILLSPYVKELLDRKPRIVFFMSITIAVLFLGALIILRIYPDAKWIKSEKSIIASYKLMRVNSNVPLFYLGKHSYSEDFYINGKEKEIKDINSLAPYLGKEFYVVVSASYYLNLPSDLKSKLVMIAQKNDSILLYYSRSRF